uniref:Vomeronasal 2, receptor 120 n=1 Tax=Mus musculus TaxID=10090 RepID=E9PX34_MOUSE|eukprot:NP_001098061.1 vomeronasal receptor Vmn2r120 precursor [Mus musculus]
MLIFVSVLLFLNFPVASCEPINPGCSLGMADAIFQDGDVLVDCHFVLLTVSIALQKIFHFLRFHLSFPMFIYRIHPNKYQYVIALNFAIEEINKNIHLLPNISLGYDMYSIVQYQATILEHSIRFLTGLKEAIPNYTCRKESKLIAVVTGTSWEFPSRISTILGLYKYPQLTFGPFDPMLSDHVKFPFIYQMAPEDTSLALGMVSLMVHFSWTWVGLIITENEKGIKFLSDLKREMKKNSVCAAFVQMLSLKYRYNWNDLLSTDPAIMGEMVKVFIVFADIDSTLVVIFKASGQVDPWRVWVTTSQWDIASSVRHFILDSFHGTLIFSQHHPEISAFKDFIQTVNPSKYPDDIFLSHIWKMYLNCPFSRVYCKTLKTCSSNGSLALLPWHRFDMDMSEESYHIYNAVYAVAHSLHEMLQEHADVQPVKSRKRLVFSPCRLHPFLKNIQFNNPSGDKVDLSHTGKLETKYDIFNFWNFPQGLGLKVKVGTFSSFLPRNKQFSLSDGMIEWGTKDKQTPLSVCSTSCAPGLMKSPQEGKASCCFDCHPCLENEISNETDSIQCIKCPDDQYANTEQTHCIPKAVTFLAYEDPLGMALACMALCFSALTALVLGVFVKHHETPIVKANNRTLSYILLISLILCFLCSLPFIGLPNMATCILQQMSFGVVFTIAVSTVLAKTVTVVLAFRSTVPGRRMRWILVSPNLIIPICTLIQMVLCAIWLGASAPFVDINAHNERGHITIMCNKGSATAFYCVLGYLGFLAMGTLTVAFWARNLPDIFNEAKFLTFSMLVFCSVWVTFLPVYHSTKGKVMVAVEVFSILASSAGLLGCIFVPKCYIILIRPKNGSFKGLRGTRVCK